MSRCTKSGSVFEKKIASRLKTAGFQVTAQYNLGFSPVSCRDHIVDMHVQCNDGRSVAVEVKAQSSSGTAENKLDHELIKFVMLAQTKDAPDFMFLVCCGKGWTPGFVEARASLVLPMVTPTEIVGRIFVTHENTFLPTLKTALQSQPTAPKLAV